MNQTPQRVLLTNMYGGIGGGEICLLHHLRHLRSKAVEVTLLLLEGGPLEEDARREGAEVVVTPFQWQGGKLRSALALARLVFSSWRLIRQQKPSVICCYTFNDFVIVGIAARISGVPVIWRTQGEVAPENMDAAQANWLGSGLPAVCRFIRPEIASTTEAEAKALRAMNLGARRIECVYLGTPMTVHEAPPNRHALRFGLFGRLVEWKGQHVFIEALAELKRRGLHFEAIIVGGSSFGDGEAYEQGLKDLISSHDLSSMVELLGFRRDVPELMAQCDVICHCSSVEPFGMVIIEAMMLGRPVIATAVRGPKESVIEGECGFLVAPNSPIEFADAMERIATDTHRRLEMGLAARRRAVEKFSIAASMSALDVTMARALAKSSL